MQPDITDQLRQQGFKVTPQRLAIYDVLYRSKAHPNAEMIFRELQPLYPTMSLATVYKTVDILKQLGLIQVLSVGDDSARYDADVNSHSHIHCIKCGRVDDVMGIEAEKFNDLVAQTTSYQLVGQQVYFYGICRQCQNKSH